MQFGFGSGNLWGTRTDVSPATPARFGVLQDVSIEFAAEVKELFGQQEFPVDVARGKTKITGKAKLASIDTGLYNSLFFGGTRAAGATLTAFNESGTVAAAVTANTSATSSTTTLTFASVPAGVTAGQLAVDTTTPAAIPAGDVVASKTSTTVTLTAAATGVLSGDTITFSPSIKVANSATFGQDLGVRYASTGLPLQAVSGAPSAAGQYFVSSAGVYNFHSADVGVAMYIDYSYTAASTGYTITQTNPLMGAAPRFKAVFSNTFEGNVVTLVLYQCISTQLTLPTKVDDYMIEEFNFSAFADAGGNVFQLSSTLQ